MVAFFLIYFGVYGGLHAYFFWKARAALHFGWKGSLALGFFLLLQVLAPILIRSLERWGWEPQARILAWIGYTWFGFIFFFFSCGVCVDLYPLLLAAWRSAFHLGPARFLLAPAWGFALPLAVSAIAITYGFWEAAAPRVERVTLHNPKIPPGTVIRVAQISDLHLGLLIRGRYLGKVMDTLRRENPDILLSTGDLVDGDMNHLEGLSERLAAFNPPLGKYAVTGNHEYYAGLDQALDFTRSCGFSVLRGETASPLPHLILAGVDDVQGKAFHQAAGVPEAELLAGIPRGAFVLFLKHRPVLERDSQTLYDLQVSGHTHKGQIFPFSLLVELAYRYPSGLVALATGNSLYTSRGTGTWGPPMRVLSPPEVTIFELRN